MHLVARYAGQPEVVVKLLLHRHILKCVIRLYFACLGRNARNSANVVLAAHKNNQSKIMKNLKASSSINNPDMAM